LKYRVADMEFTCNFKYEKMLSRGKKLISCDGDNYSYRLEITEQEMCNKMLAFDNIAEDQKEVISSAQIYFVKALEYNRILLHAAVSVSGYAYLFFAPPSGGKSTLARNWKKILGNECIVLADASPIISKEKGETYTWNSCWSKITEEGTPLKHKLHGVCIIHKTNKECNDITPISYKEAAALVSNGYPEGLFRNRVYYMLIEYLREIPCWECYYDGSVEASKRFVKEMVGTYAE